MSAGAVIAMLVLVVSTAVMLCRNEGLFGRRIVKPEETPGGGEGWIIEQLRTNLQRSGNEACVLAEELEKQPFLIGRAEDSDFIVHGSTNVSRAHATLRRDDGGVYLLDNISENGVWVDERRVTKVYLRDGLTVWMADVPLRFRSRKRK